MLPADETAWIVDPIDETYSFVRGLADWAAAVAVIDDGEARASATTAPAVDERYLAVDDSVSLNGTPVAVTRPSARVASRSPFRCTRSLRTLAG